MTEASVSPVTVDCRGLQCPAPILRLAEAAKLHRGKIDQLTVLATDPDFPADLEAWCRTTKSTLASLSHGMDGVFVAQIGLPGAPRAASPSVPPPAASPYTTPAPAVAGSASLRPSAPYPTVPQAPMFAAPQAAQAPAARVIDLCGIPAPTAVLRLSTAALEGGGAFSLISDAPGFENSLLAWLSATQGSLQSMRRDQGRLFAEISLPGQALAPAPVALAPQVQKTALALVPPAPALSPANTATPGEGSELALDENRATLLVLRNDLESLLAALMVATTSASQGMKVDVFFAFWGINLLRGERPRPNVEAKPVGFLQRMMAWMMPRGPKRQVLGKMNMGGLGSRIMRFFMRKNNILGLDQLIEASVQQGVQFVVCSMSMGIMGFSQRDIMDLPNIRFAGVTSFAALAQRSKMSLVF
jgi:peroxiredoxin family protein/TusA-related sulfurtransferase